jgi:uncharacterized protein (TIGR03067 family)
MLWSSRGVLVSLLLLGAVGVGYWYVTNALIHEWGTPPAELPRQEAVLPARKEGQKARRPPRKVWFPAREDTKPPQNPQGGEDLEPGDWVVGDFVTGGVSFSTPVADLKRRAPGAFPAGGGMGKSTYAWVGDGGTKYEVVVSGNGIESIALTEDGEDYEDMLRECRDKLGPPSKEGEEGEPEPASFYWWYFPDAHRSVALGKTRDGGQVRSYLLVAAASWKQPEDDVKKDQDALQGTWKVVSAERDGKPVEELKGFLMTFAKDTFAIKKGEEVVVKGTFKIDPSKSPKVMEMKITEGEGKGKDAHAIYELTKGGLRWCSGEAGKDDRPKEFATNQGAAHILATMEKGKEKK